jgi:uncharacterized membrane protein
MTSLSLPTSARRTGHFMTVTNVVRVTVVLALLLLAALVVVAAEDYFDPQHQVDAAQATFDPRAD